MIIKPFVSGKNIFPEIITADRFYPTRINGAGVVEAGFFTDYDQKNGRTVVRVERFDLQPDGLYLNNKGKYILEAVKARNTPISSNLLGMERVQA